MSRAGLQHALARVLEGKEIRLKNNKLPLQPRCIERFTIPRVKTHWPVIFAITLIIPVVASKRPFTSELSPTGPLQHRSIIMYIWTYENRHFSTHRINYYRAASRRGLWTDHINQAGCVVCSRQHPQRASGP